MGGKAVFDSPSGGVHRMPLEMGVAGGRLHLTVAEELADHGQAFAESESPGREAVSVIADS